MNNFSEFLKNSGLLSEIEFQTIQESEKHRIFHIGWELRILLYLGILLLSTGVGLLIYQNIDTIGHSVLISIVGAAALSCFYYCFKNRSPFSTQNVNSPSIIFDYILLLGALLFLTFEGYLQFQYNLFGEKYGLATIIPTTLFFFLAYYFDHKGILSLALTGLAAWFGIATSPGDIDFIDDDLIFPATGLGIVLGSAALLLERKKIKEHFTFTYFNFAAHLLYLACLAGLFEKDLTFLFIILLFAYATIFFLYAKRTASFYFILITCVYTYIGITYLMFLMLDSLQSDDTFILMIFYLMGSSVGIIFLLFNYKKILSIKD